MSYSDSVETKQKSSKAPQYTSHVATRVGGGKQWLVQNTVSTNCGSTSIKHCLFAATRMSNVVKSTVKINVKFKYSQSYKTALYVTVIKRFA